MSHYQTVLDLLTDEATHKGEVSDLIAALETKLTYLKLSPPEPKPIASLGLAIAELRYTNPQQNSDKGYRVILAEQEDGKYLLRTEWGRWGSVGNGQNCKEQIYSGGKTAVAHYKTIVDSKSRDNYAATVTPASLVQVREVVFSDVFAWVPCKAVEVATGIEYRLGYDGNFYGFSERAIVAHKWGRVHYVNKLYLPGSDRYEAAKQSVMASIKSTR